MKYSYSLLLFIFVASPALAQHEGHVTTPAAADPHAGHVMPATPAGGAAQPAPEALAGPASAADAIYGSAEMARARAILRNEHGMFRTLYLAADQLEFRRRDDEEVYRWDAQGWYGGDIEKFWFKSEGEGETGHGPEAMELQTLWSHAIHPWFDFQLGARWDFATGFERSHFVVGFQGLAPYSFEIDTAAFISDDGDVSARVEGEYDVWLTQRLILQPRLELEFAAQDIPEHSVGSGLGSAEFGLRLHFQVVREFAPYLGVEYERLFGDSADYADLKGLDARGWNLVLGVRTWF